jgi:AcrR family transcriptional regulator
MALNVSDHWSLHKGPTVCKMPGMTVFQRARSEEQRAARRHAILGTAAAMLAEMPVAEVTLNELSRRVGLAKSNVLRYFESREAVLLELLATAWDDWLEGLAGQLDRAVDPAAPVAARGDQVAAALAASLAVRPVLCDLLGAQAAVLERNVSPELAATYKRNAMAALAALGTQLRAHLGELSPDEAGRLAAATVVTTGALWPQCQPSAAMLAAYEADPALAALRVDFADALREFLEIVVSGLLTRAGREPG